VTPHHDLVALVHPPVIRGEVSAIYVARRQDGSFLVGGPAFTDESSSEFLEVSFDDLMRIDASLSDLRDLPAGHCATRRDESESWSHGVVPVGPLFLVRYDARPSESHPEREECGGAIVNCWIVSISVDKARTDSYQHVVDSDWVIVDTLVVEEVPELDSDQHEYVRQARIDGLIAVFHTYPKDELELNG
jgi:hypothetical protein